MDSAPAKDTFDGDVVRLVVDHPLSSALDLTRLMKEIGWRDFDVAAINAALYRLRAAHLVHATDDHPTRWSAVQPPRAIDVAETVAGAAPVDEFTLSSTPTWNRIVPVLDQTRGSETHRLASHQLPAQWWHAPVGSLDVAGQHVASFLIARVLLEHHAHELIRDLLPTLPVEAPVEALPPLGTRATNALLRHGVHGLADLASVRPGQLLAWRNIGVGTVTEVLAGLVTASLQSPGSTQWVHHDHAVGLLEVTEREPELDPQHAQLLDDLACVCRWRQLLGHGDHPLFPTHVEAESPLEVQEAQDRLIALRARDLVPVHPAGDPVVLLEAALGDLPDRQADIARRRIFGSPPATLDAVGQSADLTRERVRQIEVKIRADLAPLLEYGTATGDLIAVIRSHVRPVTPLGRLLQEYPQLELAVPSAAQPLWLVLDRLDEAFEVVDGWAAAPSVALAQADTITATEDVANDHGAAPLEALGSTFAGMSRDALEQWLQYCGIAVLEGHAVVRSQAIPDRAAALLSIVGKSLPIEEIGARAVPDRAINSLRNALSSDSRFNRVDRDRWGLAEWGQESYTGIRDMIGREIDGAGGQVELTALISRLADTFTVSPASITAYASSAPYELRGGIVRRREGAPSARKSPYETARLYRHQNAWMYRIVVTHDHLRGSGFSVPVGVAKAVGCETGSTQELTSPLGPQVVRWTGTQPGVASIRRFTEALHLQEGDLVFLTFLDGGQFDIRKSADMSRVTDPLTRALRLTGHGSAHVDDQLAALAVVVGLPRDAPRTSVLDAYRARNDREVVELLEQVWDRLKGESGQPRSSSADEEELLKLLGL